MKFYKVNFATGEVSDIEAPVGDLLTDTDEGGDRRSAFDYIDLDHLIIVAYREKAARGIEADARLAFLRNAGTVALACSVDPETCDYRPLSAAQVERLKALAALEPPAPASTPATKSKKAR